MSSFLVKFVFSAVYRIVSGLLCSGYDFSLMCLEIGYYRVKIWITGWNDFPAYECVFGMQDGSRSEGS